MLKFWESTRNAIPSWFPKFEQNPSTLKISEKFSKNGRILRKRQISKCSDFAQILGINSECHSELIPKIWAKSEQKIFKHFKGPDLWYLHSTKVQRSGYMIWPKIFVSDFYENFRINSELHKDFKYAKIFWKKKFWKNFSEKFQNFSKIFFEIFSNFSSIFIIKTCKNRLGHHYRPKHECFQKENWKKSKFRFCLRKHASSKFFFFFPPKKILVSICQVQS